MTNNGVRSGGSPRAGKPLDSTENEDSPEAPVSPAPKAPEAAPAPAPVPTRPAGPAPASAAVPPNTRDWLAPKQPVPAPSKDWMAPTPSTAVPVAPVTPARLEPATGEVAFDPEPADAEDDYPLGAIEDRDDLDEADDEEFEDEDELEDEDEPEARKLPLAERLKHTPPALVILALATVGSTGFLFFELASHTAPIQVLTSVSIVTGLVYVVDMVVCAISSYRSANDGRTRRAYLLAFLGGSAAIIAALSFAGALILFLALGF
jgi:hypothetical protein